MGDKKRSKNIRGKLIHGTTPEERFKEVLGITIEEWKREGEEKFKSQTGMITISFIIALILVPRLNGFNIKVNKWCLYMMSII